MREILFRGKKLDNGEWVYGMLVIRHDKTRHDIYQHVSQISTTYAIVDPNTVGQFTGLLDKKGNKIFEGDIVTDGDNEYEISFDKIGFDSAWNGLTGFALKRENELVDFNEIYYHDDPEDLEIIGNIHDNSDL